MGSIWNPWPNWAWDSMEPIGPNLTLTLAMFIWTFEDVYFSENVTSLETPYFLCVLDYYSGSGLVQCSHGPLDHFGFSANSVI